MRVRASARMHTHARSFIYSGVLPSERVCVCRCGRRLLIDFGIRYSPADSDSAGNSQGREEEKERKKQINAAVVEKMNECPLSTPHRNHPPGPE